jgi:hypothetical protein
MIPALLISVEAFVISIIFFFAYNPRKYIIRNVTLSDVVVEPGYVVRLEPYYGGFLGIKALWEASFMWDLIVNTGRAFRLFPSLFHRQFPSLFHRQKKSNKNEEVKAVQPNKMVDDQASPSE